MNQEPESKQVVLVGGPLDMEPIKVYLFQTTATINKDGKIHTYQRCKDSVWRYAPPTPEGD